MKLKTGDKVTVIAGANKGKTGKITKVLDEKVIVEGVNLVKKHLKPRNNGGTGEIIETEDLSIDLMLKKLKKKLQRK